MAEKELPTSAVERLLKLSGLAGRVGTSIASARLLELVRSGPGAHARRTENLVRNAIRVVETLGEMRGAAMKVGQMLSLHADLLPPEAAAVLRALQREAPRVPAEVMEYEVRGSLGARFDALFETFDREAFAAASIGQVHRARLRDGREVAVKIQYPLIREIIESDLKNLRVLFQALFALVSDLDFDPVWREIRDRLREELDYAREADQMRRAAALHADVPEIVIPAVVAEASTDRVLTMEFVDAIPPEVAVSDTHRRELRDRWGRTLFEFVLRGLFRHRHLHADPNLGNFAFREDGAVVVYDFGCVKEVPEAIAAGFAGIARAAIDGRPQDVPAILDRMGVRKRDGSAISRSITDPYLEILGEMYRESPPYTFGADPGVYRRLFDLGLANVGEASDLEFPEDLLFIDRTLGGTFGNLVRLRATADWRAIAERYVRP